MDLKIAPIFLYTSSIPKMFNQTTYSSIDPIKNTEYPLLNLFIFMISLVILYNNILESRITDAKNELKSNMFDIESCMEETLKTIESRAHKNTKTLLTQIESLEGILKDMIRSKSRIYLLKEQHTQSLSDLEVSRFAYNSAPVGARADVMHKVLLNKTEAEQKIQESIVDARSSFKDVWKKMENWAGLYD